MSNGGSMFHPCAVDFQKCLRLIPSVDGTGQPEEPGPSWPGRGLRGWRAAWAALQCRAQVCAVHALARPYERCNPGFAADLHAAAERHEQRLAARQAPAAGSQPAAVAGAAGDCGAAGAPGAARVMLT
jgi:hypothetical protein